MRADRRFQEVFGRSIQTKILDFVWARRKRGVNIKALSRLVRNSYVYTVKSTDFLVRRGLLKKKVQGRESILTPNASNPVVRFVHGK